MTTWVIGGTTGIGHAVCKQLTSPVFGEVLATGRDADVRFAHDIKDFVQDVEEKHGPIQHLVYCAGINYLEWIGLMGPAGRGRALDVIDINLMGFINVMDILAAEPRKVLNPVRVVVVSSDAARRPMRTSISYCASKAGLDMAAKVAARELGEHGWRVNVVSPGMVSDTEMTRYVDQRVPEVRKWTDSVAGWYETITEVVPGRVTPGEVAEVVEAVLAGPDHLNGAVVEVNGGRA